MEEQLLKFLKYCFMAVMRRLGIEIKAACKHFVCSLRRILHLFLRFLNVFKEDLPEDDIKQKVIDLRKLIREDDKLKNIRNDDTYLLRFLNCTDFDVESAFLRVQGFHNLILENPNWFKATSPLDMQNQIENNAKAMILEPDRDGRSIYLCKFGKTNGNLMEQVQLDELWFESVMDDPNVQASGISVIMDMQGCSFKSFQWLTPSNLLMISNIANLYPCKEIVYHVVNTSFWVDAGIKMIWPLIGDGIKEKVKFHFDDWSSLHQFIRPEVLPPEYGGSAENIDFEQLYKWLFLQDSIIRKKLEYRNLFQNSSL
ncbi:hypothetical protein ILUMI_03940 [Ignelater luminosus]|uniref:CRAL-TRIO domain-containing protein n=1 Tax=Ignelater luminosus TaxID=2038154 RepID=A0A8K0GLP0_IGNLU|nr:hypothetical protein ILUMI_03940 [Ignelater luminosus]